MDVPFESTYERLGPSAYSRVRPTPVRDPALLALNEPLARALGFEPAALRTPEGIAWLVGNATPSGASPIALAYAGHQFGSFVPQLGDGRAILIGERVATDGRRYDLQWKGSGPTPYSRRGDGRAALGPVLREYLVSEAMHALGVPTTRSLSAVATGEWVRREQPLPGAVLIRVASSHLRIGTFEFFAARDDLAALARLVDYAVERHGVAVAPGEPPAVALVADVARRQGELIARWMCLGFVHGVMNTDNTAISGETLDYGPCAYLDGYDPGRTFSSIDTGGRYAYARQPLIAAMNLSYLALALGPIVDPDAAKARALLLRAESEFGPSFSAAMTRECARKFGCTSAGDGELPLIDAFFAGMTRNAADFTASFRALVRCFDERSPRALEAQWGIDAGASEWVARWLARLDTERASTAELRARLVGANPAILPRNHHVERVLSAAHRGDLAPFHALFSALQRPFDEDLDASEWAALPGDAQWHHRTFCGT